MKAVGHAESLPITDKNSLFAFEAPDPEPGPRDLLVKVEAVSVNPVDTKMRLRRAGTRDKPFVLGWDAAGSVVETGPEATLFKPGDTVFYAGAIDRQGTNAELHVVDERIVGRKPDSLTFAEAAALPLTSITAWELLFDRLDIPQGEAGQGRTLLIVGGAGGVGSLATQLARQLTDLTIVATASRAETRDWSLEMGAHHVIDHSKPLAEQLQAIAPGGADYLVSLTATDRHFPSYAEMIAPQGRLGVIDDPKGPLDVSSLKRKSISLHWELMFTRSLFQTADMAAQHRLLDAVSGLVETGKLRTTISQNLGPMSAESLREAHRLVESGRMRGKAVLEGF
ncbi:MAG: zinc-binding alcohol dehydrogenase family protein [Kiloniellales bacterium]